MSNTDSTKAMIFDSPVSFKPKLPTPRTLQSRIQVRFKKLTPDAVAPSYALDGDAGLDLTCINCIVHDTYIEYFTGIAVEIPSGYVGLIFPRSSVSKLASGFSLRNSVGVIDSGYRGEITFRFDKPVDGSDNIYASGDKVGQLIIMPYPDVDLKLVDELSSSERGEAGYGSTGA